ncbi:hypothetical protein PS2_000458 [Malus domestica]
MACRRTAQETSIPKWRPKETVVNNDERPSPTIMTELVPGKRLVNQDVETTFEEADKRIKLLLRLEEMKARFEHFRQEAESKLPPPTTQAPLIKIRWNLHPPFLEEALEYMREFHKKHSANDLYGLKARFQDIREARVLGFEVDPYTNIDAADLPFSMEDIQYLRYHFEVFLVVSLFSLTTDEITRVTRLDAYLNTRDARIMYQEQARILASIPGTLLILDPLEAPTQNQQAAEETPREQTIEEGAYESLGTTLTEADAAVGDPEREEAEEDDRNLMGPSVLDNMEINMVHVLLADFQSSTSQPNFLDGDVVAKEAGHIDFVTIAEVESTTKDDNLKAALAELFPRSSSAKLHHLKPLYVTAHIEGYPVSKVFVDCGATVNIIPVNVMKALHRSNDELIPSGITMSSFVGDKSHTKGVLPLAPFEDNMIQAWYYDDHVGYITQQGFNDEGRLTRISVQKAIEVGAETVHQDSARLGLANFIPDLNQPNSGVNLVEFLAEGDNGPVLSLNKIQAAPTELEDNRPQVKDPLEEINVRATDDPRPLFISALLPQLMKAELRALLGEFKDCFAWSYHEMPGLYRTLVEHELRIKPRCKPFRQPPRRFSTEVQLGIKDELVRLLKARFIRTARYVEWLAMPGTIKFSLPKSMCTRLLFAARGHSALTNGLSCHSASRTLVPHTNEQ